MSALPPVLQIVLMAVAVIAGFVDLRSRRIPNWLVLPSLLLGLGLNTFLYEWAGLRHAALGMGLALLIYLPLYILRGMGAGDVKLMAAIGAIVGPANWLGIFVITAVFGGIVALLRLVGKGRLSKTLGNVIYILQELTHFRAPFRGNAELDVRSDKAVRMPHGTVIGLGCMAFLGAAAIWAPR